MPIVYPITSVSEERIANKTWINGQILYQKDIKIDSVTGAVSFFDTGEEFDQLDQLYMIEGIGYISSINNYKTYNDKSSDINVIYNKDTAYIRIMIDSYSGYETITDNTISFYYTKAERARFRITREAGEDTPYYPVTGVRVNGVSVLDNERVAQIISYKEITQAEYDALPDSKRSDGVMYCIRDSAPSGQDQGIVDVQLDGMSVVDEYGIANLEGLASAMDLAAKQDLLVEGNNITMQRLADGTVRISATSGGGGSGGLTDVTVNGTSVVSGTVAIITIPTKTSDLTNDSNYITVSVNNLTNYYTKTEVDGKISAIPDATSATKGLMTPTQVDKLDSAVTDVKVDSISVVDNNGCANINLSNKQNTLIVGQGIEINNNTISAKSMVGATQNADGAEGIVPLPLSTDKDKYLKGDGTWDVPPGGTYNDFVGATAQSVGSHGLVPAPNIAAREKFLKGDGTWADAASALNELTDVDVSSVTDGQALVYDASNQEWVPGNAVGGNVDDVKVNGVSVVDANKEAQIKSYKELTQSQYDALPSSKLTDGILYCITDADPEMVTGFSPVIYSLAERQVGTWIDGKPLYQKSYIYEGLISQDTWVDLGLIPPANLSEVVDASYVIRGSNGATWYIGAGQQKSPDFQCQLVLDTSLNTIQFYSTGDDWTNGKVFLTIRYTKTTDVPGSGDWTDEGVPTHHYSTDEKVIGTWIDGKPLYEKTLTYSGSSVAITPYVWTIIPFTDPIPDISYFFHTMVTTDCSDTRIRFKYDGGYLKAAAIDNLVASQLVITIRYTKTTD